MPYVSTILLNSVSHLYITLKSVSAYSHMFTYLALQHTATHCNTLQHTATLAFIHVITYLFGCKGGGKIRGNTICNCHHAKFHITDIHSQVVSEFFHTFM